MRQSKICDFCDIVDNSVSTAAVIIFDLCAGDCKSPGQNRNSYLHHAGGRGRYSGFIIVPSASIVEAVEQIRDLLALSHVILTSPYQKR